MVGAIVLDARPRRCTDRDGQLHAVCRLPGRKRPHSRRRPEYASGVDHDSRSHGPRSQRTGLCHDSIRRGLKFWLLGALLVGVLLPAGRTADDGRLAISLAGMFTLAVLVGIIESIDGAAASAASPAAAGRGVRLADLCAGSGGEVTMREWIELLIVLVAVTNLRFWASVVCGPASACRPFRACCSAAAPDGRID